jgi:lipopolysaccharide transport system permease protein/teichoic acid transport system permease protein
VVLILLMLFNGVYPSLYWIQAVYYLFALCIFLLAVSWMVSALNVFLKDVAQLLQIVLQVGFWLTPILWSVDIIPEKYHALVMLNPIAYVVQGYRDSFVLGIGFWEHPFQTLYFWSLTFVVLAAGVWTFRRLRPHFAEVI